MQGLVSRSLDQPVIFQGWQSFLDPKLPCLQIRSVSTSMLSKRTQNAVRYFPSERVEINFSSV